MIRRIAVAVISLLAVAAAKEPLEFTAYLTTTAQPTRIVLRDTAAGRTSGWLTEGDTFGDIVVGRFESTTETLLVTRAGQPLALTLRSSQVRQVEADRLAATELARRLDSARAQLGKLSQRYRSVHPEVIKQRQSIAELERQLAALRARG